MQVLKFGGTSVGSVARMHEVIDIITRDDLQKIVVLSAMSGTTNDLVRYNELHQAESREALSGHLASLEDRYIDVVADLYTDADLLIDGRDILHETFDLLKRIAEGAATDQSAKIVLAQGELLSTRLFALLCKQEGHQALLIPALDFMKVDDQHEPDLSATESALLPILSALGHAPLIITQGYICRNAADEIDNLQRGGSDYTATILGAVTKADEIQIWTDIDGVHNNDPRLVDDTMPIRKMSYREAAELAYFGAKILHPTCVLPAERMEVPLRLKYTMDPDAPGTLISREISERPITAIAAKDDITAIKIYSHRMLMAYGFVRKVFQVFEDHQTPVDMITTAEVAVSLTIDDTTYIEEIRSDLKQYGEVEVESGYSIICIVGNELYTNGAHMQAIFSALNNLPVRMISMGGSKYNISILIRSNYKRQALIQLNTIFEHTEAMAAI